MEMGGLPVLPFAPPSWSCSVGHSHPQKPTTNWFSSPSVHTSRLELANRLRRQRSAFTVVLSSAGEGEGEKTTNGPAAFFGEDGMVEDMDGYLNYVSLEYDSVWNTKPAWCQPWTIFLSGTIVVAFSWVLIHSVLITTAISILISAWWYIFLYSYPKAYSDMIAERRKKVASGAEDTYGMERSQ